ncbi:hypothetical protein HYPSUDRAFT_46800 [Hypholoma sublateritium FD-334 SS-4]|uniref:Secreted protein n=1 Tax=Hypholoma sublateritium (strain FD-334 SS-4) TaxID=945553 RepID=A0A0D2P9F9_HYPSF|nr:hypothetical protein HYPSUDRAFT_46800 [Hypholoma sublateritium FD-334 SS-4]
MSLHCTLCVCTVITSPACTCITPTYAAHYRPSHPRARTTPVPTHAFIPCTPPSALRRSCAA